MSIDTKKLLKLISEQKFSQIQSKSQLLPVYAFYYILSSVDVKIFNTTFPEDILYNVYSLIEKKPSLFTTSKQTRSLYKENLQDIVLDYIQTHQPKEFTKNLVKIYIDYNNNTAFDILTQNYEQKIDDHISYAINTLPQIRFNTENTFSKQTTDKMFLMIKRCLNLIIPYFDSIEHDFQPQYDVLSYIIQCMGIAIINSDNIFTRKYVEFLLTKPHKLSTKNLYYLTTVVVSSEQPELFETFLEYYIKSITEQIIYENIYRTMLDIGSRSVFREFRKILSRYYDILPTNEFMEILTSDYLNYKNHINRFEELRRFGYSIEEREYIAYEKSILQVYPMKELIHTTQVIKALDRRSYWTTQNIENIKFIKKVDSRHKETTEKQKEYTYNDVMKIYLLNREEYDTIQEFYRDLKILTGRDFVKYNIENDTLLRLLKTDITKIIVEY